MKSRLLFPLLLCVIVAPLSYSQPTKESAEAMKSVPPEERAVQTKHRVVIDGQRIDYTATAGTINITDEEGNARASMFYISYTRDGVDSADRPITFSFNGGPGSSSVWLHLGLLGPKRVAMDSEGNALPPPYRVVDNGSSILDVTDLVFIDPVMTGYSRPAPGVEKSEFTGQQEDVESVGEFIRRYVNRHKRWGAPKFLIGESYGTTRAAALSNFLQQRHGMYLDGVMLVSSILNFQTARFDTGNDLPYILFLPTYTATAWYHGRLGSDAGSLRASLDEAEEFALSDYTLALMKGNDLELDEKNRIATRLSQLTGLSTEFVLNNNLRVPIGRFVKELRRDERKTVGRLDSRFVGVDRDAAGDGYDYDPSYSEILGPYSGALKGWITESLGYESEIPYEILTGRVRPWNYGNFEGRYVNVTDELREAMTQNPDLRVYVANGYYDLATPYFATEYTFDHLAFDDGYKDRVEMSYFEAGHMMYIRQSALERMREELVRFVTSN